MALARDRATQKGEIISYAYAKDIELNEKSI